jgi:hypothetical protein
MLHEAPTTPAVLPPTAPFSSPGQGGGREGEGGGGERGPRTTLGRGNGWDEETKMEREGGDIPYAYAVRVEDAHK